MKIKEIIKELNKYKHNNNGGNIFIYIDKENLRIMREDDLNTENKFKGRIKEFLKND